MRDLFSQSINLFKFHMSLWLLWTTACLICDIKYLAAGVLKNLWSSFYLCDLRLCLNELSSSLIQLGPKLKYFICPQTELVKQLFFRILLIFITSFMIWVLQELYCLKKALSFNHVCLTQLPLQTLNLFFQFLSIVSKSSVLSYDSSMSLLPSYLIISFLKTSVFILYIGKGLLSFQESFLLFSKDHVLLPFLGSYFLNIDIY